MLPGNITNMSQGNPGLRPPLLPWHGTDQTRTSCMEAPLTMMVMLMMMPALMNAWKSVGGPPPYANVASGSSAMRGLKIH